MGTKTQKRVTSADVARAAGVARSTVSYVLNRTPHQSIPDQTRERVLTAARKLGYTPSAAARTLKRGRSDVVLCFLRPWPLGSAAGALLAELTTAFEERGLTLVTHIEHGGRSHMDQVWSEISPAAVITYHPIDPATERSMRSSGVRSVVVLFADEGSSAAQLVRQDTRIGSLQAEHLISAGHVRIGYAYPAVPELEDFAAPRLDGVESVCAEAGIAPPDVRPVAMSAESAAAAITHWRSLPQPISAVCAYNDDVAQAILAGARLAGVAVPEDLAIIGADDVPAAALTSPPLTTIAIDHLAEAQRIVETVMAAIENRPSMPATDSADLFSTVTRGTT